MTSEKFPSLDVNKTYLTRALAEYAVPKDIVGDTQPGGHPAVAVTVQRPAAEVTQVEQFDCRPDDN